MPAQSGLSAFSRENMMAVLKSLNNNCSPLQAGLLLDKHIYADIYM